MKKQKSNNFDREKKIHRVVKGNKQNKYKKQFYNYDVSDELQLDDASSKRSKPIR
jgi:hypothetical protein